MAALLVRFGYFPVRTVGALYLSNVTLFHLYPTLALRPDLLGKVLSQSFAIAALVAVESLQAMDLGGGHTGEHVDPNGEFVVQGA